MKKFLVVLAVAVSGILSAQTNITNDLNINNIIKELVISSSEDINSDFKSLLKESSDNIIDSLLDRQYKSSITSRFDIDFRGYDSNNQLLVAVFDLNAYKPENFNQSLYNQRFITTLNNIEASFKTGTLLSDIETVFLYLK
jgi:hypothetical protein